MVCAMNPTIAHKRSIIIAVGADPLLRQGYHGTGIQEFLDSAGVPKGSFYNYFKGKEDFGLAAMEDTCRDHICRFEVAPKDTTKSPR